MTCGKGCTLSTRKEESPFGIRVRSGDNAAAIVQRADDALYRSKREGRDRVTLL